MWTRAPRPRPADGGVREGPEHHRPCRGGLLQHRLASGPRDVGGRLQIRHPPTAVRGQGEAGRGRAWGDPPGPHVGPLPVPWLRQAEGRERAAKRERRRRLGLSRNVSCCKTRTPASTSRTWVARRMASACRSSWSSTSSPTTARFILACPSSVPTPSALTRPSRPSA